MKNEPNGKERVRLSQPPPAVRRGFAPPQEQALGTPLDFVVGPRRAVTAPRPMIRNSPPANPNSNRRKDRASRRRKRSPLAPEH
jgi:hypothetical protein